MAKNPTIPPPEDPGPDDWIRWPEVHGIINRTISKTSVYRMMREGRFPSSIKIEGHARLAVWVRSEVIEWKRTYTEAWRKYPTRPRRKRKR